MNISTVISKSPPVITAHDRCDKCGAQAQVIFGNDSAELMFCKHHTDKFEPALFEQGFEITIDKRDAIH